MIIFSLLFKLLTKIYFSLIFYIYSPHGLSILGRNEQVFSLLLFISFVLIDSVCL